MKILIQYFCMAIIISLTFGCNQATSSLFDLDEDAEAFILTTSYSTHAETPYVENYFLPLETRDIIIKGFFKESEANQYQQISIQGPGLYSTYSTIGNAPNSFLQEVTLSDNTKGYVFVVPVTVTAPPGTGSIAATISPFTYSNSLIINIGLERGFDVIYNCMTDYNIYSSGYEFANRVEAAFNEINTDLNINVLNTNMQYGILPFEIVTTLWIYKIHEFYEQRGVLPTSSNLPNEHEIYLFGCDNVDVGVLPLDIKGLTIPPKAGKVHNYRLCTIFVGNINAEYPNNTDNRKKYVTSASIHELGHARGMDLLDTEGYYYHDITDVAHTGGHNGKYKTHCLMRTHDNTADPDFTEARFLEAINNPRFCFGHKMMLFNIGW